VICAVVFNSLLAYSVAVVKPVGYKVINALIFLGYMVPTILNIFPLLQEIKAFGFLDPDHQSYLTFLPLWLGFGANAYYYMLFRDYFARLPKGLVEAASMDGANQLRIFTRIVLPLSRPIIGIVAIFAMTAAYSDFLLPYCVLQSAQLQTVVVGIYNISNINPPLQLPEFLLLILLSIIPQIVIFLVFQRLIMNAGAGKGSKE
ncbi:MAG: carbohydrate ABC transporter permease, partial [Bacilli bacterium]|nr:carbohydrate ABC transporter permease [Bacilli bacterium]